MRNNRKTGGRMTDIPRKKVRLIVAAVSILVAVIAILSVNITEITVTGNERYSEEQVRELLFPDNTSRNSVVCYIKNRFTEHRTIPFVEDYRIAFQSPTKVEVIIYEKSVVGYVSYMSSYMYFDKDGIIVESANAKLDGIPWINGLKFGHIVLYQPLPVEDKQVFDEILNLTQALSGFDMKVDKIQYNSFYEATLLIDDLEVVLGDNTSLNGKISELHDMLPQLEGRSGTLYLDTYDETKTNMMFRFQPKA